MLKYLFTTFLASALACATVTSEARTVRLTRNPEATKGCVFLGNVSQAQLLSNEATENGLRNKAAKLGANLVFVGHTPSGAMQPPWNGEAYRCEAAPPVKP
jgi:Domain of unknown function (DUF4156)